MIFSILITVFLSIGYGVEGKNKEQFLPRPTLKDGQVAVFIDEKYEVSFFESYDSILISKNCFKGPKISCDSYSIYKKDSPMRSKKAPHPSMTEPAALFCEGQGGRNLIGVNHLGNETNLCRFKDGSMISSWDLYLKFFPAKVIK